MAEKRIVIVRGRIVWVAGNLFTGQVKTVFGTQTPRVNAQGEKMLEYGFGLSVSKADLSNPEVGGPLWAAIHEEAFTMFPSRQIPPAFAMKYKDGDGVDDQGKPFALREGYAGACVFSLKTSMPIRFFRYENGGNVQIAEGIKCGDYVEVQVSVQAHAAIGQGKAGLYLNPLSVRLQAPGKEIANAPSGDQVFGTVAPAMPANYIAPPPPPAFNPPPPVAPMPMAAPAPHYAVLPQTHQPAPPPHPTAVPMAAAPPVHAGYPVPPVPR